MKKTIALLPALLAVMTLTGCNPGSTGGSGSVELLVWEDASNIPTLETIADYFLADYRQNYPLAPEVTIRFEARNEAAAVSDLLTIGESGNGPDIAAITSDTLSTAVQSKLVAPVAYDEEIKNCFDPETVANVTIAGTVYAYPITSESQTIMYDKRAVSDPSIFDSFDSLLASGEKVAWDINGDDCAYYMFGFMNDSVLFGDNGNDPDQLDLATPQSIQNLTDVYTKYFSVFEATSPEVAGALLAAGEVAGLVSSPFMYKTLADSFGEENVGLHKLPTINGQDMRPFSGYKEYVVSSYSDQPALAQMFANYIVSAENQITRMLELNYLPTRYDGEVEDFMENGANADILAVYQGSYELSKPMPTITKMGYYWTPMINFCKDLYRNASNVNAAYVESGLKEVEATINRG